MSDWRQCGSDHSHASKTGVCTVWLFHASVTSTALCLSLHVPVITGLTMPQKTMSRSALSLRRTEGKHLGFFRVNKGSPVNTFCQLTNIFPGRKTHLFWATYREPPVYPHQHSVSRVMRRLRKFLSSTTNGTMWQQHKTDVLFSHAATWKVS